jgi:hypothetical protein
MWNRKQHTYEEIRAVVVDILLQREAVTNQPVNQWVALISGVSEVFARREGERTVGHMPPQLHPHDAELVRDAFWDLFRQGLITLGLNDSNPEWPWFRLSHFGQQTLQSHNPYRFHNTASFLVMIEKEVPDLSPEARVYLEEAVAAFYGDCLLASCVMLGVAAEAEFLRLIDIASRNAMHGSKFASVQRATFIRQKIIKFQSALAPLITALPQKAVEDIDTNFSAIQSVLRIARNDAGHPSAASPYREQVYVLLQLFVPFARQLMLLRAALK